MNQFVWIVQTDLFKITHLAVCLIKLRLSANLKGVGSEIRCLIDFEGEVKLKLEIQEDKETMKNKKFVQDEMASIADVIRLTEEFFHTNRSVYGDSAFASVNTAVRLGFSLD